MTMHLKPELLKIHTENKLLIEIPRAKLYCVFIQLHPSTAIGHTECNKPMQCTIVADQCILLWATESTRPIRMDLIEQSIFAPHYFPTESLNQPFD